MGETKPVERPLAPFMLGKYYRWQIGSVSSILTRISGNALIVSFALGVWWLAAAATSDSAYALADAVLTSWFGDLAFTLSLLGIAYHLLAGLRHIYWDAAKGMDLPTARKLGWACIWGSLVLTAAALLVV